MIFSLSVLEFAAIEKERTTIESRKSGLKVTIVESEEKVDLPNNSPFVNWREAKKFSGPLPFTFTFNKSKNEVLIIQGVRQNWKPNSVKVIYYESTFINSFKSASLANAFIIKDVSYFWKKGRTEKWIQ